MGVHRHDDSLGPPLYIIRLVFGLILYFFGPFAVFGNDTLLDRFGFPSVKSSRFTPVDYPPNVHYYVNCPVNRMIQNE